MILWHMYICMMIYAKSSKIESSYSVLRDTPRRVMVCLQKCQNSITFTLLSNSMRVQGCRYSWYECKYYLCWLSTFKYASYHYNVSFYSSHYFIICITHNYIWRQLYFFSHFVHYMYFIYEPISNDVYVFLHMAIMTY